MMEGHQLQCKCHILPCFVAPLGVIKCMYILLAYQSSYIFSSQCYHTTRAVINTYKYALFTKCYAVALIWISIIYYHFFVIIIMIYFTVMTIVFTLSQDCHVITFTKYC